MPSAKTRCQFLPMLVILSTNSSNVDVPQSQSKRTRHSKTLRIKPRVGSTRGLHSHSDVTVEGVTDGTRRQIEFRGSAPIQG